VSRPDLILIGQMTVDHVVPAKPGPWTPRLGGNALYAAAGARLWLEPARIGVVSRIGAGFPFDAAALLASAGIGHVALNPVVAEHIIEWIIYEEDGSRRCLPRNADLRHIGTEGGTADRETYLDHLLAISPSGEDIPDSWLSAPAVHLAPQARDRHTRSLARLRGHADFISVDPSPFYSRSRDVSALAALLSGATAFLPSELEIGHLAVDADWHGLSRRLCVAGFPEVVIKRSQMPVIVSTPKTVSEVPTQPTEVVDPTGAGDAFCGAYAACRLLGMTPADAAARATISASLVVRVSGVEPAMALQPATARAALSATRAKA
jgi:hypothetical protein